ncbi:MAG: hypothetical protein AVDCRST_MAG52-3447, partial [uncultured Blastococcus sp.]
AADTGTRAEPRARQALRALMARAAESPGFLRSRRLRARSRGSRRFPTAPVAGSHRSGVHLSAPALTRPTAPPLAEPHAGLPATAIGRHKSTLEIITLYV